jgi:hypothetical protein
VRRFRLAHHIKTSLWFIPVLFVLGGVVLSLTTTAFDDGDLLPWSVTGDPNAALQILYLIAFAMLTLTGLVLSLLVVAVQLAMGTFSPRIVRQILQDRPSQTAIGLFAGTFAHALLAMREVRTTSGSESVPGLAVLVAIVLVLACIGTLVWYLNHIGQSLRTAALVEWVADDTITSLDRIYPDHGRPPDVAEDLIPAPRGGVVFAVGSERLVALARRAGCRLELLWAVGDYVPKDAPLIRIAGEPGTLSRSAVTRCVALGPERTLNQDVAYGVRMLVDIAERSLAAGPFADPTTVVQAIDRLHDIMRQISGGRCTPAGGRTRTARPASSSRRSAGTGSSASPSTRSGRPAPPRRRSAAGCARPWRTSRTWRRRSGAPRWSASSACSPSRSGTPPRRKPTAAPPRRPIRPGWARRTTCSGPPRRAAAVPCAAGRSRRRVPGQPPGVTFATRPLNIPSGTGVTSPVAFDGRPAASRRRWEISAISSGFQSGVVTAVCAGRSFGGNPWGGTSSTTSGLPFSGWLPFQTAASSW